MALILISHKGRYNVYSTICDAPIFDSSLSEQELREWYQSTYGSAGIKDYPQRISRCKEKGTSSHRTPSLREELYCNRAGENEEEIGYEMFIEKYLGATNEIQ